MFLSFLYVIITSQYLFWLKVDLSLLKNQFWIQNMIPKNKEIESALGRLDSIIRTLQSDTKPSLNRLIKSTYPKIELPPSEATKLVKSLEAVEKQIKQICAQKQMLYSINIHTAQIQEQKNASSQFKNLMSFYKKYNVKILQSCNKAYHGKMNFWEKLECFIKQYEELPEKIKTHFNYIKKEQFQISENKLKDEKNRYLKIDIMEPILTEFKKLEKSARDFSDFIGIKHIDTIQLSVKLEKSVDELKRLTLQNNQQVKKALQLKNQVNNPNIQTFFSNTKSLIKKNEKKNEKKKSNKYNCLLEQDIRKALKEKQIQNQELKIQKENLQTLIKKKEKIILDLTQEWSQNKQHLVRTQGQELMKSKIKSFIDEQINSQSSEQNMSTESEKSQKYKEDEYQAEIKSLKERVQVLEQSVKQKEEQLERSIKEQTSEYQIQQCEQIFILKGQLDKRQQIIKSFKGELQVLEKEQLRVKGSWEQKYNSKIEQLCGQIDQVNKNLTIQQNKLTQEKGTHEIQLNKKEEQMNALKQEQTTKIKEIQTVYSDIFSGKQKEIAQRESANKQELLNIEKVHIQKMIQLQQQNRKNVEQVREKYQQYIQQLNTKHTQQLKNEEQECCRLRKEKQEQVRQQQTQCKNIIMEQRKKNTSEKEEAISQLKIQLDALTTQYQNKIQQLQQQHRSELVQARRKIKEKQEKVQQLEKEINNIQSKNNELKVQGQALKNKSMIMEEEMENLQKQKQQIIAKSKIAESNSNKHIFLGNVLEDKEDDKLFLIENIEKVSGKRINKTELLYNYPKLSKINFHEHIDKKPDYVLLVRLQNNMTLVGYSRCALAKGESRQGNENDGFIGSLTNKAVFTLKTSNPKAKLTQYNDFYMVFGNAELRIQNNTNVVTSNLGSTFKFFNTKDLKDPTVLFGSEKREAILACYEVFQIQFEQ